MTKEDRIFTDDELRTIGQFFEILFRVAKRTGILEAKAEEVKQESAPIPQQQPQDRLIPLSKWNKYHEWPSQGGLRHLVFYEKLNGFNKVIRRVGRRILICEKSFFEWARTSPQTMQIIPIKGRVN